MSNGKKIDNLGQPYGKRSAGRPCTSWLDNVEKHLQHFGVDNWREVDRNS